LLQNSRKGGLIKKLTYDFFIIEDNYLTKGNSMIYKSASNWLDSTSKKLLFFGMSGLGKTYVSNILRQTGEWFHYSVDYRIGTHYMGEHIVDNVKSCAMKDPFLAELLRSDSIYIASNITFDNLAPLSTYLGKPGDSKHGGLPFSEYQRRQKLHRDAEKNSLLDTTTFIEKGSKIYGYQNFVCDSGGSICEVVDPFDPQDHILRELSKHLLLVWIKGTNGHTQDLIDRFDKDPKPMCYQPKFLLESWDLYKKTVSLEKKINPDSFVRWIYSRALEYRQPRYAKMAENWGITINAEDLSNIKTVDQINALISKALQKKWE
jgi:hypothetical protein